MKNLFTLITLFSFLVFLNNNAFSQSSDSIVTESTEMESAENLNEEEVSEVENVMSEVESAEAASFHQIIKQKFIEGGPGFMGIVLLCLILGLALAIERIIYLNMAQQETMGLYRKDRRRKKISCFQSSHKMPYFVDI